MDPSPISIKNSRGGHFLAVFTSLALLHGEAEDLIVGEAACLLGLDP